MNYKLFELTDSDREKLIMDCDSRQRTAFGPHREFFVVEQNLTWAIDWNSDSYLIIAPSLRARSSLRYYFFRFQGFNYYLCAEIPLCNNIKLVNGYDIPESVTSVFLTSLKNAFSIYGPSGKGSGNRYFRITFNPG